MLWLDFLLSSASSVAVCCTVVCRRDMSCKFPVKGRGWKPTFKFTYQLLILILGNFRVMSIKAKKKNKFLIKMYITNQLWTTSRLNKNLNDNSGWFVFQHKHKNVSEAWRIFLNVILCWIKKNSPESKLSSISWFKSLSNFADLEHRAACLRPF